MAWFWEIWYQWSPLRWQSPCAEKIHSWVVKNGRKCCKCSAGNGSVGRCNDLMSSICDLCLSNSLTKYTLVFSFSEQPKDRWQLYNRCSRMFSPVHSLSYTLKRKPTYLRRNPTSLWLCSYASWSHLDKTQIYLASPQRSLMRAHEITSNAFTIPTETAICNIIQQFIISLIFQI